MWHIMKTYSYYGIRRFILCLGHKGDAISDYFENYHSRNHDYSMKISDRESKVFHYNGEQKEDLDVNEWDITFAITGENTLTGGRLKRIEKYIDQELFFCTYGDGVCDVDIGNLYRFHIANKKAATLTGVHLPTTFGIVEAQDDGIITSFREKPALSGLINGGYFVFAKKVFDYIEGDQTVLEEKPFKRLVRDREILMYRHDGSWYCMDTYKDYIDIK